MEQLSDWGAAWFVDSVKPVCEQSGFQRNAVVEGFLGLETGDVISQTPMLTRHFAIYNTL
jgi:hypothetical protein